MYRTIVAAGCAVLILLGSVGCRSTRQATGDSAETLEAQALVSHLEQEGVFLQPTAPVTELPFTEIGRAYRVGRGGTIQIYEYPTEGAASMDVSGSAPRLVTAGSVDVYQRANLVAVYLGDDLLVAQALRSFMGPPEI